MSNKLLTTYTELHMRLWHIFACFGDLLSRIMIVSWRIKVSRSMLARFFGGGGGGGRIR